MIPRAPFGTRKKRRDLFRGSLTLGNSLIGVHTLLLGPHLLVQLSGDDGGGEGGNQSGYGNLGGSGLGEGSQGGVCLSQSGRNGANI